MFFTAYSIPEPTHNNIPSGDQGRGVQRVDNTIQRTNHYSVDSVVCSVNTYPLDSDLSGG